MGKTVYILGAGFSKSVGAPLQAEIIQDIYSLNRDELEDIRYKNLFFRYRKILSKLLSEVYYIEPNNFKDFPLEDIFTSIDKCINDNISLRHFNKSELLNIRQKINALISMLIDYKLKYVSSIPITQFASYLLKRKRDKGEPFSIISTNWDIIIENALKYQMEVNEDIDYCFEAYPYSQYDPDLTREYLNTLVKVIKLHGSMNWLQCQRCQRVFYTFFSKIAIDEFLKKPKCKYCKETFPQEEAKNGGANLISVIIMPTFLKDLNNYQLKLSWKSAGIELQEASKIVFFGYSFPLADFEFRQLLARTVRPETKIDVVLHEKDTPEAFGGIHRVNEYLPEKRYKAFFGKREIEFYYYGVERYIKEFCKIE